MTSTIQNVAIDCANPRELAQFWSAVTGHPFEYWEEPDETAAIINLPGSPALYFNAVPEPKTTKNRVHICLRPDLTRDAEVERILELGATMLVERRNPDGSGWVVLGDPEGNEFCVLRSAAERAAQHD